MSHHTSCFTRNFPSRVSYKTEAAQRPRQRCKRGKPGGIRRTAHIRQTCTTGAEFGHNKIDGPGVRLAARHQSARPNTGMRTVNDQRNHHTARVLVHSPVASLNLRARADAARSTAVVAASALRINEYRLEWARETRTHVHRCSPNS